MRRASKLEPALGRRKAAWALKNAALKWIHLSSREHATNK